MDLDKQESLRNAASVDIKELMRCEDEGNYLLFSPNVDGYTCGVRATEKITYKNDHAARVSSSALNENISSPNITIFLLSE